MQRDDFLRAFAALARDHEAQADNLQCVECYDCERCRASTFCRRSRGLIRCHYCVDSLRLVDCTHCHGSSDLTSCSHLSHCRGCSQSAYLERCVDCSDCRYCYGCVGLTGREFHILNEPYERSVYFATVAQLNRQLRDWTPPRPRGD